MNCRVLSRTNLPPGTPVLVIADSVVANGLVWEGKWHGDDMDRNAEAQERCDFGPAVGVFAGTVVRAGNSDDPLTTPYALEVEVDFEAKPIIDVEADRDAIATDCRKLVEAPPFCFWTSNKPEIIAERNLGDPEDAQFLGVQDTEETRMLVRAIANLAVDHHRTLAEWHKKNLRNFV